MGTKVSGTPRSAFPTGAVLVAAAVVLSVGCRRNESEADPAAADTTPVSVKAGPTVQVVQPTVRAMTHEVVQPGFVEAFEQTAIYSKVSGFIKKFYVDIGDKIKKGDLLCEVFVPELEEEHQQKVAQVELDKEAVEQANRLVEVAQRELQTAVAELAEAKANVGKYDAEVVRWASEVKRLTQMVQEKVVDKQVLDETQKQLDSSKAAKDAAQAAVTAHEAARMFREADLAKAKVDVEFAKSKVKVSDADERRTAALLAYTKVTAPYDGIVTVRNANTGDYVQAASGDKEDSKGVPIFVVARTDLVRIFVDVPEAYARYVCEGTKAEAGQPPRGVRVQVRGQVVPMQEMFQSLSIGLALAVVVTLVLLTGYFQSFRLGLVSIGAVPGVICGVAAALWSTGTTLNIESFMGAIMSIGVSVSNSVMLVTFMNDYWQAGLRPLPAAVKGAKDRLRPILMTAFAMVLGTLPMAMAVEKGSEMTAPLGRAVIGGLVVSTFVTLLVVPAIFVVLMNRVPKVSPSMDPNDPHSRHFDSIPSPASAT